MLWCRRRRQDRLRPPQRPLGQGPRTAHRLGPPRRQRRQDLLRPGQEPHRPLHPGRTDDTTPTRDDLDQAVTRTNICIAQHLEVPGNIPLDRWGSRRIKNCVQLIIVDESERLRPTGLELLRDRYDRDNIALILIGMPGREEQFSHYPPFYSRVGFAHHYRPLGNDELLFVLQRHWHSLGKTLDPDDFTDAQAVAAIARITRGDFRLLERLFPQIERVLKITELHTITNDVVEAAQSTLVIGVT